jgi:hypothetical protein
MNLKGNPTQVSFQLPRGLLGPDRAEVTKRSNNVGPDVDDATHGALTIASGEWVRQTCCQVRGEWSGGVL